MKTIILVSLFAAFSLSAAAQDHWTYDMYKITDHTNFRSNPLFEKTYDPEKPDISLINAALFFMVNEERVERDIPVIDYHPACEIAAYNHSRMMYEQDFFSHFNSKDPTRETTSQRAKLAGITNPKIAENIAYNYPSGSYMDVAEKFMDQWMNSKGHRSNILSKSGYQAGCGVYVDGRRVYGTQVFQWFYRVKEGDARDKLPPLKDGSQAKNVEAVDYRPAHEE